MSANFVATTLHRFLLRIRPNASGAPDDAYRTLGWYLRIGAGPAIRGIFWRLRLRHARFPLFVGPNCSVTFGGQLHLGPGCAIGAGTRINAHSIEGLHFGPNVTLRENAWIQASSSPIRPGVGLIVGSNSYIGPQAVIGIGGPIKIGKDVQFGAGCVLISENHAIDETGAPSATEVTRKGIAVGDGTWLGHRVVILDGVTLGANCVVGAASVVTRSFPDRTILVGNPARPVAARSARATMEDSLE